LVLEAEQTKKNEDRDLDEIRNSAQKNTLDVQLKNKLYYDKSHKSPKKYAIGNYIMVKNVDTTPGVNKKHIPKFKGPYEIKKVLPNDRYVIQDIPAFQVTQRPFNSVYEARNMKPWIKM